MPVFIPSDYAGEISLRISRIRTLMREQGLDALLIASNANILYTTLRFFRGYVYIPSEGNPLYFVIRPNIFEPAYNLIAIRKPEQILSLLTERGMTPPHTLGLEEDTLSYSDIMRLSKAFPDSTIANASPLLRETRMIKTPFEVKCIRDDAAHQAAVYHRIARLYKPDMTDLELQIEIERVLRLEGCLGFARTSGPLMDINMGSVINGDNADTPTPYDFAMGGAGVDPSLPVGADGAIMHTGTSVMVDMNGSFNLYQSDMTRVWSIGELPPLALKAHECSRRILRRLETESLPRLEVKEMYRIAEEVVAEEGLQDYFMGHRQKVAFIGHGVGIELNEQPAITAKCKTPLTEGMILAVEPKFVIPGVGAVGVENTYLVTATGLENLTPFPEEINNLL